MSGLLFAPSHPHITAVLGAPSVHPCRDGRDRHLLFGLSGHALPYWAVFAVVGAPWGAWWATAAQYQRITLGPSWWAAPARPKRRPPSGARHDLQWAGVFSARHSCSRNFRGWPLPCRASYLERSGRVSRWPRSWSRRWTSRHVPLARWPRSVTTTDLKDGRVPSLTCPRTSACASPRWTCTTAPLFGMSEARGDSHSIPIPVETGVPGRAEGDSAVTRCQPMACPAVGTRLGNPLADYSGAERTRKRTASCRYVGNAALTTGRAGTR